MALIVQKFGGSSVADAERIFRVAKIITDTYQAGNQVCVVLSAQGDTTDDLIEKAQEINPDASRREMDMLLACGEQMSIALMAMAIEKLGFPVVSLCGWQVGMNTDTNHSGARIKKVECDRVRDELDQKRIVLVAGFQGVDRHGDVTTLGRGGGSASAGRGHPRQRIAGGGRKHPLGCRRGQGGGAGRGPVPNLYRCGRRIHLRPARRARGA